MSLQTKEVIKNITELVDIEDKTVLELGCGTGRITFALAESVQELVAIDFDAKSIEDARQRNSYDNVVFLVEDIEDFDLEREFDLVLSVGVGYMYLRDLPSAIKNISRHQKEDGIALLICGSPEDEYQKVVDLLVEENVKTASFYNEFENHLSNHFVFEKRLLKGHLSFLDFEDVVRCFQRELKEEYRTDLNDQHVQELRAFFQRKGNLTVENDSQAYICRYT